MEWLPLLIGGAIGVVIALGRKDNVEWLTRQAEKHEWRARNSPWRPAGGQARQARRYRQLAAGATYRAGREKSQETRVTVDVTDGLSAVNCPECNGAMLLNVGAAQERNETSLEAECDHCHTTYDISWVEAE